jgi:hypothetical protein
VIPSTMQRNRVVASPESGSTRAASTEGGAGDGPHAGVHATSRQQTATGARIGSAYARPCRPAPRLLARSSPSIGAHVHGLNSTA